MRAGGSTYLAILVGLGCGASGAPASHVPGSAWAYVYANPVDFGKIFGVPFGGGTSTTLAMGGNIGIGAHLTFDGARIYYSVESFDDAGLPTYSLGFMPIAGGASSTLVSSDPSSIAGIASNGQALYVSRQNDTVNAGGYATLHGFIEAIPVGGTPAKLQTVSAELGGVAVDGRYVYWTQTFDGTSAQASGSIHRTALAGGADETLATGQLYPVQVALDASGIYWINLGTPGRDCTSRDGTLMRLAPASTSPVVLMSGLQGPGSIAVRGGNVYVATAGAYCNVGGDGLGTIYKVASASGQPTAIVSGITGPQNLYADGTYLYFTKVVDSFNGVLAAGAVPM
jgi:hypothetical protein